MLNRSAPVANATAAATLLLLSGCLLPGGVSQSSEGANSAASNTVFIGDPGAGGVGKDAFGVVMAYPTRLGGEQWSLSRSPEADPRFSLASELFSNGDGSFKALSPGAYLGVFTSNGYHPELITTYNRGTLAQLGYLQAPSDWRDVEITGYVRLNSTADPASSFSWYARGGMHSGGDAACEGSAYKADLHFDGRVRLTKESYHADYSSTSFRSVTTSLRGRWVGFKSVIYNLSPTSVKIELFLDEKGDRTSWRKVHEHVDNGSWAGNLGSCGGPNPRAAITWGGPVATFGWDQATDVDFKWLSVREIDFKGDSLPASRPSAIPSASPSSSAQPSGVIPISNSWASSDDGNPARLAVDSDLATRWSCAGVDCYLLVDLGELRTVGAARVAWYLGVERSYRYILSVSAEGREFFPVRRGSSSGTSEQFEDYSFDPQYARYVLLEVQGNQLNVWSSVRELQILSSSATPSPRPSPSPSPSPSPDPAPTTLPDGTPTPTPTETSPPGGVPTPVPLAPPAISSSGHDGNPPGNVADKTLSTRWSCEGSCWLQADLGSVRSVSILDIAWMNGNQRRTSFRVSVSLDGVSFSQVLSGQSSGTTSNFERYQFPARQARFVRISGDGNTVNAWNSISEIQIFALGGGDPPTTASWSKWSSNGPGFTSRWESYAQPTSSVNYKLLIGAPHGGYDTFTEDMARSLCQSRASECIVTFAEQPGGERLNVNRPTEGASQMCTDETRTANALQVYSMYNAQVGKRVSENGLRLFIELHGNSRPISQGYTGRLEVGVFNLTSDEVRRVKEILMDLRSQVSGYGGVEINVQGVDEINQAGDCTEKIGSMKQVHKGLHLELSYELRDSSKYAATMTFLNRMVQELGPYLMR